MTRHERTPLELYRGRLNSLQWRRFSVQLHLTFLEREIAALREAALKEGLEA